MVLNTKYEFGQQVYFLDDKGKCHKMIIDQCSVYGYADGKMAVYYSDKDGKHTVRETYCFPTVKAMKEHVFGEIIETS